MSPVSDQLVGHILFSPVTSQSGKETAAGMGLAPMAVLPERQRQGISSRLVQTGLEMLRDSAGPFAVALGHPGYYPRFGSLPASKHHIDCQWDVRVPDNAFAAVILGSTLARYRDEFDEAM